MTALTNEAAQTQPASTTNTALADTPFATESPVYDRQKMHPDAMRQFEANAIESSLVTPEEAKAHVQSGIGKVLRRYDLLSTETKALADLDRLNHTKLPDAATREQWRGEAHAAMLATYGPKGVGQALKDAKAFIKQDPQLYTMASRGFGDHKDLVLLAARLGREARNAGKLK